jgi:hypothetical protein
MTDERHVADGDGLLDVGGLTVEAGGDQDEALLFDLRGLGRWGRHEVKALKNGVEPSDPVRAPLRVFVERHRDAVDVMAWNAPLHPGRATVERHGERADVLRGDAQAGRHGRALQRKLDPQATVAPHAEEDGAERNAQHRGGGQHVFRLEEARQPGRTPVEVPGEDDPVPCVRQEIQRGARIKGRRKPRAKTGIGLEVQEQGSQGEGARLLAQEQEQTERELAVRPGRETIQVPGEGHRDMTSDTQVRKSLPGERARVILRRKQVQDFADVATQPERRPHDMPEGRGTAYPWRSRVPVNGTRDGALLFAGHREGSRVVDQDRPAPSGPCTEVGGHALWGHVQQASGLEEMPRRQLSVDPGGPPVEPSGERDPIRLDVLEILDGREPFAGFHARQGEEGPDL